MAPMAIDPDSHTALNDAGAKHILEKTAASVVTSKSNGTSTPPLAELDASLTTYTHNSFPKPVPELGAPEYAAQDTCTDHMILAQWTVQHGWEAPTLKPYGPLSLMPTCSVLHYATECFEGMKLYRGVDGRLRLFRPRRNAARMLNSATRIALPGFDPEQLLRLVEQLCAVDGPRWLPKERGSAFLYIRPTMISNDEALGVQRPKKALLYVLLNLMPAFDQSSTGLRLLASSEDMVRAWPGGFGYAKVGANYGPSLLAQGEARRRGFNQVLWLLQRKDEAGRERTEVTEAGASNFFVVLRRKDGKGLELTTPKLDGKIILDGVTRRSVLDITAERLVKGGDGVEAIQPVERFIEMQELVEAHAEGRLVEAFAAGTAFFIAPISAIEYKGEEINVPMCEGGTGTYARLIKSAIGGIMYGEEQHEWGHVIEEEGVKA